MAAVDYFLKIEGADGESTDADHKGEIQVESFRWGASAPADVTTGQISGRIQIKDFQFHTRTSNASALLLSGFFQNQVFKKAVLSCRKAGKTQQEYLKITFSGVRVGAYDLEGGGSELIPKDQVVLRFDKIEFEYRPQRSDGSLGTQVVASYNLQAGK